MIYAVEMTDAAYSAIRAQARFIGSDRQAPLNAARWLVKVWDVVDGLEHLPKRHGLAAENALKTYEVRQALAGNYLILFTVDEPAAKVWVIGFRHGSHLPIPDELPETPPDDSKC